MSKQAFAKAFKNEILTNISIAYLNTADQFVGSKVFPFVQVNEKSGDIVSYGKQAMRVVNDKKANKGSYNKVAYDVEISEQWNLKEYGLIGEVTEADQRNAENPLDAEKDTTEMLTHQMMLNIEKRAAGVINDTVVTNNVALSGSSQFTHASSNPFEVVDTAIKTIFKNTGKYANSMVLSFDTVFGLKNNPKVIERFRNVPVITDGMIKEMFGALFGITNVYIASSQEMSSNSPVETNLDLLWKQMMFVYYSETAPTLKSVSFAKTFALRDGLEVRKAEGDSIAQLSLERDVTALIRVKHEYDQAIIDNECGYLVTNTVPAI